MLANCVICQANGSIANFSYHGALSNKTKNVICSVVVSAHFILSLIMAPVQGDVDMISIYIKANVCVSVCMFKIYSLTP
jgi:hypothetical protein